MRSVKGPAEAIVLSRAPSTVLLPEAEGASWLGEGCSLAALRRGEGAQPPVLVGGLKGALEGAPSPCLDQVDRSSQITVLVLGESSSEPRVLLLIERSKSTIVARLVEPLGLGCTKTPLLWLVK